MADDYSISAKITADASGFEAGVKKAENASKNLSKSVSSMVQGLGKSGLVGALGAVGLASQGISATLGSVVKIARKVSQTINECAEAYRKQYKAEMALETAVKNNPYVDGSATRGLKDFAGEMQKISELGDEEILPMMSQLIATGRTEAETMDIIRVATDMSATGAMSFDTAVQQLNATFNGNIGRLGLQNAELKNLTDEELKSGKAVEILGEKYKGLASSTADTTKQFKNALGDLKENLGKVFETALAPMRRYFTEVINNINDAIKKARDYKQAMQDVFGEGGINVEAQTDSLQIAFNEVLNKQREVTQNYYQYIKLYGEYIDEATDETAQSYKAQITDLNKQIKTISEELNKRKSEADAIAKQRKEAEENAENEKKILELKEKHLKIIAEQKAKWKNIKEVTGEEVTLEEKLKFYQDDLVAIMTEAGGQISTNNQYYKNQKKIIDDIIKAINKNKGVTEEVTEGLEVVEEKLDSLQVSFESFINVIIANAEDVSDVLSDVASIIHSAYQDVFISIGEELVEGGKSWKSYASIAVKAIAEILKSLSAQLSAMAVAKAVAHDYSSAGMALAGATTALIASGTMTAVANNLEKTTNNLKDFNKNSEITVEKINELKSSFEGMSKSYHNTPNEIAKVQKEMSAILPTLKETYATLKAQTQDAEASMRQQYKKIQDFLEEYKGFYKKYNDGTLKFYNASQAYEYRQLADEYDRLVKVYNESVEKQRQASNILGEAETKLNTVVSETNKNLEAQYQDVISIADSYQYLYDKAKVIDKILGNKKLSTGNMYQSVLLKEQKIAIAQSYSNLVEGLSKSGATIGEKLASSIINGATKADFLSEMKNYLKENIIKLSVFSDTFMDTLKSIGYKISSAIIEGASTNEINNLKNSLSSLYDSAVAQVSKITKVLDSVFNKNGSVSDSVKNLGENIGQKIINGMINGMEKSDFLSEIKSYLKEKLLQTAVYTEKFQKLLNRIGSDLTTKPHTEYKNAVASYAKNIKSQVLRLWEEAQESAKYIDEALDEVFGKNVSDSIDEIDEKISSLEESIKSFSESISDLGGSLADNFINAISEGLNESDFMDTMKKWIRNILVQSVIYTNTMKAEIEAIGRAISKGVTDGFSELSMQEIKRDISYIFNQANQAMSGIDRVLDSVFTGYATGTNNASSGLHLVGEAGPELVRFRGGEQVLNTRNTQKAFEGAGGNTNNFNVTFNNLQDTSAFAMMNQLKQYNRQMAINGII